MKLFGLLNLPVASFGGTALVISTHLYYEPLEFVWPVFAVECWITYISLWVNSILMLLLANLGCCAAHESNLKTRRVMLIIYAAVMSALFICQIILVVWLVFGANWARHALQHKSSESKLWGLLEKVSCASVDWWVVGWLIALSLVEVGAIVMAKMETKSALRELRQRRRKQKDGQELAYC